MWHLFYAISSFVNHFKAIGEFTLEWQSGNAQFGSKSAIFVPCDFLWMTSKTIGHLFYATPRFGHHSIAICEFKLELQSKKSQFGYKSIIVEPCDLEILGMTLNNNRTPLLRYFKLYASFLSHLWIQTGDAQFVSKSKIFFSPVTLKFDKRPWKSIGHLS